MALKPILVKNKDCDFSFFYLDEAIPPIPPSWQVQVGKTLWNCELIPKVRAANSSGSGFPQKKTCFLIFWLSAFFFFNLPVSFTQKWHFLVSDHIIFFPVFGRFPVAFPVLQDFSVHFWLFARCIPSPLKIIFRKKKSYWPINTGRELGLQR